jgi:hypothetical protein
MLFTVFVNPYVSHDDLLVMMITAAFSRQDICKQAYIAILA